MEHNRGQWGSNFGFLMATVGAAVGLGNIWGFPNKMGSHGGFAFLLVYLFLAVTVGFAIMLSELAIGRKVGRSVMVSYKSEMGKFFGPLLGWLAMISPFLILSFYTVLGAYCLEYMCLNLADLAFGVAGVSNMSGGDLFGTMLTNQLGSVVFTVFYIALCYFIIKGGIKDGIEKFNTVGMPTLFFMLIIVIIRSITLPGASEGLKFMFTPNFEPFSTLDGFIGVLSAAGGQMFFSLSLAMGITVTYGSYLSKKENLVKNSALIIISDTAVALMAGLAVLPAAFALGGDGAATAGPKLLFITLQDVFYAMGGAGPLFGVLFYLLVSIAAITSTVALLEVLVTYLSDNAILKGKTPNRSKLVLIVALVVMAESAIVALDGLGSNGMWVPFNFTGMTLGTCWLEFMDCLSEGIAMPLGALLMSVVVGWVIGPKRIRDEVCQEGVPFSPALYKFFVFCIRFVAPVGMAMILWGQLSYFFGQA